jgi:hypothetical protein
MADHGKVEYATATGNDLAAHEATYKGFVQLAYVGSALCVCIAIGLAIGGTTGRWGIALPIIFLPSWWSSRCSVSHLRQLERLGRKPCTPQRQALEETGRCA